MKTPLLENLIQQHYSSTEDLSPETNALLNALDLSLSSQGSDESILTMMDSMPFGITLIDKQKKILHANQSALDLMGYVTMDELMGRICHDTLCPAHENRCPILDLKQSIDRSDRILITKDNQRIPILKSVSPITYNNEEVLLEAFIDIREQKQAEELRAKEFESRGELARNTNEIIQHLAGLEKISEIHTAVIFQVLTFYDVSRVQYYTYNPIANNLRLTEVAGVDAKLPVAQRTILPAGTGAAGKAAASKEICIADEEDLTLEQFPQMLVPGVQAQVAIPILSSGDLIGVLDVQDVGLDKIDPDAVMFLETLAIQIGVLVEALRNRTDMQEQFAEVTSLQRRASVEGWLEFAETNPISSSKFIFDQQLNTAIQLRETDLTGESNPPAAINPLEVRGSVIGALGIADHPDQPLTQEEIQLLESVSEEVAEALERARLFESSQRSASELALLNEMGATFAQANSEDFIIETIFSYTTKLMLAPQFFIAVHDPADKLIHFPFVMMEGERITKDHPNFGDWSPRSLDTGLTGYMISNRLPIMIDSNAEQTLNKLGLPQLQFRGRVESFLGVPMVIADRTLGVIGVLSNDTPNLYGRHQLDLLTTIASQAAVSINNTRLFQLEQERAQQERTVRTITDKVRLGANTQAIMQIALEELSQVLNADLSTIQLGTPEQMLTEEPPLIPDLSEIEVEEIDFDFDFDTGFSVQNDEGN